MDGEHGGGRAGEEIHNLVMKGNRKLRRDGTLQEKDGVMLVFQKEKGGGGEIKRKQLNDYERRREERSSGQRKGGKELRS